MLVVLVARAVLVRAGAVVVGGPGLVPPGPAAADPAVGVLQRPHLGQRGADVLLVLEDHRDGPREQRRVQGFGVEDSQGPGPVDGLGDAGRLAQVQGAQLVQHVHQPFDQGAGQPGLLALDDVELSLAAGVLQRQVQAASFQRRRQVAGVVAGQQDVRLGARKEGADLRDGDLELREQLEQDCLERLVGAVHLVDEQHDRLLGPDRIQQRPHRQEALGEEQALLGRHRVDGLGQVVRVPQQLGDLVAQDLRVEQLLAVVPVVQRLGLVLTLVALQAHQAPAGGQRERLGQLGLADPGRALQEQRLVEPGQQEHARREPLVGKVAVLGEPTDDLVNVGELGVGQGHARCLQGGVSPAVRVGPGCPAVCRAARAYDERSGIGMGELPTGSRLATRSCSGRRRDARCRSSTLSRSPGCRRRRGRGW